MKKVVILMLTLALCLNLWACGSEKQEAETVAETTEKVTEPIVETTEAAVTVSGESAHCKIDGIYVDNGFEDADHPNMKMVYVCYSVFTNDQNLSVSSKYSELTFESGNTYSSETYFKSCCDWIPSYYSSDYLEDIYMGESLKVVSTFKVPMAEFDNGERIDVCPYGIPRDEELYYRADQVQFFDSADALAQAADPEGYARIQALHEPADAQTVNQVKNAMNGYYWSFYVNSTSYEIEFYAPNRFQVRVRALGVNNGGTYEVQKGFVVCTYDSNGSVVEIPYSWKNNDIDLNLTDAFDVNN